MTTTAPSSGALAPLRHRDFRWLLGGRFANFLGNAVAPVALAFAVLDLTGSVSDLGLVVGARSATNVALLLFGGVVADRLPRAVVLRGSALAAALTQAAVATLVLTGTASIALLMALSAVNGAVAAMAFPASAALTPQTVPASIVRQANAVLRLAINSATVGGAAVGGALVAAVGPGWGIAVDAATFAVSGICFTMIRVPDVPRSLEATTSTVAQLREGWGEFVSRQWVWAVVLMAMAGNAAYTGGVVVLGPAVADTSFGRRGWGLALAVGTVGMVVGGLVALRWQPRHALRWGTALGLTWSLPLLALGLSPTWVVVAAAMFVSGLALEQFGIAWDVSLQQHVPPDRLARVYSYDAVGSFVAIPVGEVAVGPLAGRFGVEPTLIACAAVVLVAVSAALSSRSVRSLTRLDVPPA